MARNLGTLTLNLIAQTAKLTTPIKDAENKVRTSSSAMSNDINRINNSISGAERSAISFRGALLSIGAAIGVSSLKNVTDEYLNLQNRLKLVTENQLELTQAMKSTLAAAQAATIDWAASAEIYSKLAANTQKLGLSQKELGGITETIAKAISISGVSSDEASRSMIQLGQALSLGKLQGQDFKSVMQQTPAVMKAVAIGLGKTTGELLQMSAAGQLTNEVLIDAFQKAAPTVAKMYAETATTIGGALTTVKNSVIEYIGSSDEAVGASKALVNALTLVSENFSSIANVVGIAIWASLTKAVMTQTVAIKSAISAKLAEIATTKAATAAKVQESMQDVISARATVGRLDSERSLIIAKLRGNVATAEKIALELRASQVAIQLSVAERALTAAINAQTAATTANAAATSRASAAKALFLGLTGGWVGLGVAVASVAAGYFLFRDRSVEAEKVISIEGEAVADLSKKYAQLNEAQKDNENRALAKEVEDLGVKFRVASSDLSGFIENLPISDEKINQYRKINNQFTQISGSLRGNPDSYYSAMKDVGVLSDKQLAKVYSLAKSYDESRKKLDEAKKAQDALAQSMAGVSKEAAESEKRIIAQAEAAAKAQEIYDKASEATSADTTSAKMEASLLKTGKYTKAQIDIMTKWAKDYEYTQNLMNTPVARKDLGERLNLLKIQEQNSKTIDSINEKEKERLDTIKEQSKALKVNAKVLENAKKFNFASIESQYKLPSGLLSAINMQESKGKSDAVGPMTKYGTAKGGFQFLDGTAKRFGLLGNDVYDTGKAALAAAKYFDFLYKKFGDWNKAISAYHAGEGNVEKGTNIGPINRQYVKNVSGYIAGLSGQSFSKDFSVSDYLKDNFDYAKKSFEDQVKLIEDQAELQAKYFSEAETRAKDHKKAIENIKKTFLGNDAEISRLTELENQRFKAAENAAKLQQEQELEGWSWVGEEKIKKDAEVKKAIALANNDFNQKQKEDAIKSIEDQANHDLAVNKKTQEEKAKVMKDSMNAAIQAQQAAALDARAKSSMNSYDYGMYQITTGVESGLDSASKAYEEREKEIMARDDFNQYIIDSEIARNELLLQAEMEYQSKKDSLLLEAQEKQKELQKAQIESQLQGISTLLGAATSLVGGYLGEASGAYKTLFGIQRAYNTAVAAMNVWTAASQAYAQSASPTVWGRAADAAIAAAQAQGFQTLIQGITPVGMAHSGMTSIPREGTWLLDGGERVVSPQQNQDLTKMINSINSNGGGAISNQNNMKILNLIDRDELVGEYMRGSTGEKIVLNLIKSNASTVKKALG